MKVLKQPFVLIIFGPTAVGKTEAAIEIAQRVPAEIINMDMGQFYTPLTIGTAKPDWHNEPTPHHLFDIINDPHDITVSQYRALVQDLIHYIWSRGSLPILVGGSGFYLKSLFFPPRDQEKLSDVASDEVEDIPRDELWQRLHAIDPNRAQSIHPHDVYRLKRALSIWLSSNQLPSELKPVFDPIAPFHITCFTRERSELYGRINERVNVMMQEGWLNEVKKIHDTPWEQYLLAKKIIGYDILLNFLASDQSEENYEQAISLIQQKTRNYAKRQLTFWRMLERELHKEITLHKNLGKLTGTVESVDLTLYSLDLYISELLQKLIPLFE